MSQSSNGLAGAVARPMPPEQRKPATVPPGSPCADGNAVLFLPSARNLAGPGSDARARAPASEPASHARSRKDCHSRRSLGTLMRCLVVGTPLRRLAPFTRVMLTPWLIVLLLILSRCGQGREDHRADATFTAERPLR